MSAYATNISFKFSLTVGTFFFLSMGGDNSKATVFFTMLSLFRLELAQQYIWAAVWAGLGLVPPFVVFKLVQFSQDISTYNRNEALFYIAALLVSIVVRSAGTHIVFELKCWLSFLSATTCSLILTFPPSAPARIAFGSKIGHQGHGNDQRIGLRKDVSAQGYGSPRL